MDHPHIIINVAMSADGKLDTVLRRGTAISSPADRERVDSLRASVDAVLVGGHTLLVETPRLTVKSPRLRAQRISRGLPSNPARGAVVTCIGPEDLPPGSGFLSADPGKAFIFTTSQTTDPVITRLQASGVIVEVAGENKVDLQAVIQSLQRRGLRRVLVEGGGTLIASLFQLNLVDEVFIYMAPRLFGGVSAPTLVDGPGFEEPLAPRLHLRSVEKLDAEGGILIHYTLKNKE
jgi:2,5-diamino-6-(ribosylamino)-4(3H)-pyrimidinone 5'-phosphate reductase